MAKSKSPPLVSPDPDEEAEIERARAEADDTMRVLRVQLEFRHPGLLFSAAPDPLKQEADRATRKPGRAERLTVAEQAKRARYLVPGGSDQHALPARNLLGSLKAAGNAFRAPRGEVRTAARIAAGAAVLPSMIPLVSNTKPYEKEEPGKERPLYQWDAPTEVPSTAYREFSRMVPIPGRKGGSVPCGRALIEPPLRTVPFDLCLNTQLFAPWDDDPRRSSEALAGKALIEALFQHAGKYVGLCAWRPSAPFSPGPFGKFRLVSLVDTGEVRNVDSVWRAAFEVGDQGAI